MIHPNRLLVLRYFLAPRQIVVLFPEWGSKRVFARSQRSGCRRRQPATGQSGVVVSEGRCSKLLCWSWKTNSYCD